MKNLNLKAIGLFVLTFMFFGVFALNAAVKVDRVSIEPKYFVNNKLYIENPAVATSFQYLVTLNRGLLPSGGFPDGTCKIQVMYASCATCSVSSYVPISNERNIVNADYKTNSGVASAFADLSLVSNLPANTTTGGVLLRFVYTDNGQTITKYLTDNYIAIQAAPPSPSEVANVFIFPSRTKYEVGIKLPEEGIELQWNAPKLETSLVNLTVYEFDNTLADNNPNIGASKAIFSKIDVYNSGSLKFSAAELQALNVKLSFDNHYSYYLVVRDSYGPKFARSGLFCFVNEHPPLWPGAFPHAFWIFRPDSSGSGYGELKVRWLTDKIDATNVSIDLYNEDGTFNRNLTSSTPNNGNFKLPKGNGVPLGPFYQFKITSVEKPTVYGYSELFHHYLD